MTDKKPSFMAAVKAAQTSKQKIPLDKAQEIQQAKFKNKPKKDKK